MMQLRLDQIGNANSKAGKGKKRTGELRFGSRSKQEMRFDSPGDGVDAGTELREPSGRNIASKTSEKFVSSSRG